MHPLDCIIANSQSCFHLEYQLTGVGCDDNTVPADSGLRTYMSVLGEGLSKMGVNVKDYNAAFFQTHLENAGFVDVEVYTFKVPWGWWPKDKNKKYLGRVTAEVCSTGKFLLFMLGQGSDWPLWGVRGCEHDSDRV